MERTPTKEWYRLMQPFLDFVDEAVSEVMIKDWEREATGLYYWGERSGYFVWVEHHPGQLLTKQIMKILVAVYDKRTKDAPWCGADTVDLL